MKVKSIRKVYPNAPTKSTTTNQAEESARCRVFLLLRRNHVMNRTVDSLVIAGLTWIEILQRMTLDGMM